MNEHNDRDLDFLLDSFSVDETSERLSGIEQKILNKIEMINPTIRSSYVSDRWVQFLSASAVLTAFVLAVNNIPMWEGNRSDIYNLYLSGSYLFVGG